jgi:hypothetical protein
VRSERARAGTAAGVATLLLAVVLSTGLVSTETEITVYVLVLAAIGLASLARTLAGAPDLRVSPFAKALARRPQRSLRPPELVRVEREITLGVSNAGHLQRRLVPLLRDVAVARLNAPLTRERVGDEAWELLRPDRPAPDDLHAPGASLEQIRRVVARLEEL